MNSADNVPFAYLNRQFADCDDLIDELRQLVITGKFTLGEAVVDFEKDFADLLGVDYAIGVGSGTDAIKLSLKALGIGAGDEVITAANTFVATVGAIVEIGALPRLVDCDDSFCMNTNKLEQAISERTKAIVPVHLTGNMVKMNSLMALADKYNLHVVEDSCQALLAHQDQRIAGTWGIAGAFSFHPLKSLNVWGDGGIIVTNDEEINDKLRLLRNHGMYNRDKIEILGYNSRLDSIQAIVARSQIGSVQENIEKRISNAAFYDANLADCEEITIPLRDKNIRQVYHLYMVFADRRDELYHWCRDRGIGAKIHYPIPLYKQEALNFMDYQPNEFPVANCHSRKVISFPVDEFKTKVELQLVIETVTSFYQKYPGEMAI